MNTTSVNPLSVSIVNHHAGCAEGRSEPCAARRPNSAHVAVREALVHAVADRTVVCRATRRLPSSSRAPPRCRRRSGRFSCWPVERSVGQVFGSRRGGAPRTRRPGLSARQLGELGADRRFERRRERRSPRSSGGSARPAFGQRARTFIGVQGREPVFDLRGQPVVAQELAKTRGQWLRSRPAHERPKRPVD